MNGNCHFVFGASLGTAIALNLDKIAPALPHIRNDSEAMTLFILGGLMGGIFPDIDNPTSHMGQLSAPVSTWIGKIGELFGKTGSHHRGILHDPIVYLLGLGWAYACCPSLVGFFVGCMSHLFLDMFNPAGIPFLFGVKHLHLGKIRSGSTMSIFFTWICVFIVLLVGLALHFGAI